MITSAPTSNDSKERLKQIRERRERYELLLVRYEYPELPTWDDIDFLLSLLEPHGQVKPESCCIAALVHGAKQVDNEEQKQK